MRASLDRLSVALADRYRIEREIGRGGMATVYLAEDLKHARHVALKVLHPELGAVLGTERFLTEIRTTANLQHPNILPLFDSGESGGLVFYVMPFVEGETLRARMEREGPMLVADAIRVAQGVAAALDFAHRKGIIHRDVKPENILLQDGQALVADFGVALAVKNAAGSRITQTGISVGTPSYMSPEQAAAERQLDGRSDQYALGAVLYEMLSGEPPFTGPNASTVMSRLMAEAPRPLEQGRPSVPRHVSAAVHRALEKVPGDRFASTADFAKALEAPAASPSGATSAVPSPARAPSRARIGVLALAGAILVAVGWLAGKGGSGAGAPRTPTTPTRLALLTPTLGGSGTGVANRLLTFMPDGSTLLYAARHVDAPNIGLHLQSLDAEQSTLVPGTDFVFAPSVSPDGRWIAGRSVASDLVLLPMRGATSDSRPIAPGFAYYAWHPDGTLWVTRAPFRVVERLQPGTRTLERMLEGIDTGAWMQQVLADGRRALVVLAGAGSGAGQGALLDLERGTRTVLVHENLVMIRLTAGLLVYLRNDGMLLAAPFDERSGTVTGEATVIATSVSLGGLGDGQFEVAPNGTVAYVPEAPRSLVVVDRAGDARPLTPERGTWHNPRFSPDGRRLTADRVTAEGRNVWMLDLDDGTVSRVTFAPNGHDAAWERDGRGIHFLSAESGELGLRRVRLGSSAPPESLFTGGGLAYAGDWLPDGSGMLAVSSDARSEGGEDIVIVRNDGRGPLEPLVVTPSREYFPAISPDGKWLAFTSNRSGGTEVFVRSMADDRIVQVSQAGGGEPVWSRDGRELFYRSSPDSGQFLMAIVLATDGDPRVVSRARLFRTEDFLGSTPHANYDVTPDGRGFVFVRRNEVSRITVLQNLPALVAKLRGQRGTP